jgi:hypothetical protein
VTSASLRRLYRFGVSGLRLRVLATASLVVLSGCVTDQPGVVYHVRLPDPPEIAECVALSDAIVAAVGVSSSQPSYETFRPWSSRQVCMIEMTAHNSPRPCRIIVAVSSTDPTISVSITESDGTRLTNLSTSSEEMAQSLRAILSKRYPNATIRDLHPVQGPFAP